ncbi:MAG: hypothetical protein BSOLF_2608 [Candidatus Carbobacillus altaicus]|uniref:RDD domain-containing protein n=1 Tax=Candidatus Carbonibacillus altaicus TaxID=2163959 RepID=A0A2R6Y288_9BACL|nr:MAG: hypothetical protein BSOLF_2608 [Candidatus Carbobacillus altaicus]
MARLAGFWVRLFAYLIDWFVLQAAGNIFFTWLVPDTFTMVVLWFVLILSYFILMTYVFGQTLGKMVMGIRVEMSDGKERSFGAVVLRETIGRAASLIFFGFGYWMIVFDKKKRAMHDRIAETVVTIVPVSKRSHDGQKDTDDAAGKHHPTSTSTSMA